MKSSRSPCPQPGPLLRQQPPRHPGHLGKALTGEREVGTCSGDGRDSTALLGMWPAPTTQLVYLLRPRREAPLACRWLRVRRTLPSHPKQNPGSSQPFLVLGATSPGLLHTAPPASLCSGCLH